MNRPLRILITVIGIFYFNYIQGQYTVLKSFLITDGAYPCYNSLVTDGTKLYGMTAYGGTNGGGVIFSINPDGTGYSVLRNFRGYPTDGVTPYGSLTISGTTLYGMTYSGGAYNYYGTIFSINTNGSGFTILHSFSPQTGSEAFGSLIFSADGTTLYGMTYQGGSHGDGVIFSMTTSGSYTVLVNLDGQTAPLGQSPYGDLILNGSTLYGMTYYGGVAGFGTIFSFDINSSSFTTLYSFNDTNHGQNPLGSLIISGTTLYGMTSYGGTYNYGVIFAEPTTGGTPTILDSFTGNSGSVMGGNPDGSLTLSNSIMYGMTSGGGLYNKGVIFKESIYGGQYSVLKSFNPTGGTGYFPEGSLLLYESALYGMTYFGGTDGYGVIFRYALPPDIQATNIIFTNPTSSQFTASWTIGDGTSRDVFVEAASSGTASPVNNTTYTANTVFGSGSEIGSTGWYCVYNGTGSSVTVTGLSPNTQYQVMVCEYNGVAGSEQYQTGSSTNNPMNQKTYIAWTGGISTDWSVTGNWSNGFVPTSSDNVYIPSGLSNYPHVTYGPNSPATCDNLVIANSAILTVDPGKALTISGTTTLNGTECLVINDGGSLIYAYGTPMGTIKRLITPGTEGSSGSNGSPPSGYHFMSSPVTSTTFGNVFGSSGNSIWAQSYGEPTNTWINQRFYNSLTPGTGYSIWVDPSIGTQTAIFSGTFNSDGVSQTLTQSAAGNPGYNGWNLIGNPYTSAINWDYVPTWHGSVDGTVYIWSGTQYLVWNSATGFQQMSSSDIPAQSGFFVHCSSATTITIPWAARVHDSHSLYKEAIPNLLHLGITGNNYRDDTYIRFIAGATAGFDTQYDAYKLWGISDAPQLYSIIPGANLAGNALPSIESNPEVSIGLKVGAETTYTITADGMENFDASVPIHLDDLKLGVSTDLRENPSYSFTAAPGDSASRFRVRFNSAAGIEEQQAVKIFIYTANEQIVLNNAGNYEGNYYIYGINGQLLVTLQIMPGKEYVNSLPAGMYIVKAVTGSTIITRKVVLL
jgi:uncharacterized repeat protein (TIGR03803 family)